MPMYEVGDRVQAVHYVTSDGTPATHNFNRCSVHVGDIGIVRAVSSNGSEEWIGIHWDRAREGMHNLAGMLSERSGYNVIPACIRFLSRDNTPLRQSKPKRVSGFAKFHQKVSSA